jgi:hypothetical protein
MSKKREYKTTCVGDYKITIDTYDNDVPYVMVCKHLNNDNIENIFGYYSKDVVDFFLTIISKRDQQAERIAELEEQLKNAIVPKFKYGQTVWCVYPTNEHRQGFVFELDFVGYTKDKIICCITDNEEFEYDEVFATKEKAEAKLEELTAKNV